MTTQPSVPAPRNTGLKVAVGILGVLAVGLIAGLIVVSGAASSDNDKQSKQIAVLRQEITTQQAEAKKPSGEPAQIAKLQKRVKQIEDCLPEVATLISSLEVDQQSLFVSSRSQISRVCNPTIYGNSSGGE